MTSPKSIFFLMCLEKIAQAATVEVSPSIKWTNNFILVKLGHSLTLTCLYKDKDTPKIYWFKQTLEEKSRLIGFNYRSSSEFFVFDDFKNNPRFNLHTSEKGAHLTITDLEFSDSATYYCADKEFIEFNFTEGYDVVVEGSELTINKSASGSIQSGGSGTLNCTVHTGTCDEDHTVYWFRNSGRSDLRLVYRHRGRKNQCEKKTSSCFYSLSMKNLNISQTGTFYCAVAACGHILFGKGTKVDFEDKESLLIWVSFLSTAWIFTIILVIFLSISIFMMKKRKSQDLLDSQSRFPATSTANTEGEKEEDSLHYAAVGVNRPNRSRKQRTSQTECVYSGVKQ